MGQFNNIEFAKILFKDYLQLARCVIPDFPSVSGSFTEKGFCCGFSKQSESAKIIPLPHSHRGDNEQVELAFLAMAVFMPVK